MAPLFTKDRTGVYPLITFRIRRNFPRPAPELVARFREFFIPDISDAVGRMYTMDETIHSLYTPAPRLCGPALTVKAPGDNLAAKMALTMIQPGDVLVIDAQGFTAWCLGGFGMLVNPIKDRGLAGVVVNGGYRDVTQAREEGFPMFAKAIAPWTGPKRGPGEINVPVCCGGVVVNPGDLVVGDDDGVVVVPQEHIQRIADHLSEKKLKPNIADWDPDYLAAMESAWEEFKEDVLRTRGVTYLD